MAEYIERESLINHVEDLPTWGTDGDMLDRQDVIGSIENRPAADVAPVRHARWDENGRCSKCGGHAPFWCMASTYYKSPWCQECGAKMDLEG